MSGICGFINFSGKHETESMLAQIKVMNSTLYSAGDGFTYFDDFCAIGQNDCYAVSDSFVSFFYGELYNCQALADKLKIEEAKNEAQVVLRGFEECGSRFFQELSGKFVYVIYDRQNKTVSIVRDRIGSKPMYYYKAEDFFLFSTELNSLLATGLVPKQIDRSALSQYLQLTYIPAPACIIQDVYKVKPAVIFTVNGQGNIQEKPYWQLTAEVSDAHKEFDACKNELKELLYNSVQEKMMLYPNSGAFLSGGFDSSIVVGVMSDLSRQPVKTFTIGYDQEMFDESELAGIVAKKNGTEHTVLKLDWDAVIQDIDTVLNGIDEPYADSSLIATYAVCKLAKAYTDVAFMGDGGDELFAGYNKYLISYYGEKYRKVPRFLRKGVIEPLVNLLPKKSGRYRKAQKVISSVDMPLFEQRKRLMSLGFKPEELQSLILDGFVDPMDFIKENYEHLSRSDEQTRAQYVDFKTVLEGDMLPKVETAGKLSGLKTCAPILDGRIIDFAYSIPTEYKIRKKERKIILKETFRYLLPEELFSAPKHGFAVPIGEWLENELKEKLICFASEEFLQEQGLFDHSYIKRIIDEHFTHKKDRYSELWAFFVFQNWYQNTFKK